MGVQLGVSANQPTYKSRVGQSPATLQNVDYLIKEYYDDATVQRMTIDEMPFFSMLEKTEDFTGDLCPVPVIYGNSHGRSRQAANANTNAGYHRGVRFQLYRVKGYASAVIDGETGKAARKKGGGAFFDVITEEMDRVLAGFAADMGAAVFRDGWGILADAKIPSGSSNVINLNNAGEHVHFEVGMVLDIVTEATATIAADYSSTDAAVRTASNSDITAITRDVSGASTITLGNLATDIDTDFSITASSSYNVGLALNGDASVSGTSLQMLKLAGLSAWMPSSLPGSDSFFYVDRSVDRSRLAGRLYDGSSQSLDEALIDAVTKTSRDGAKITHIVLPYEYFGALAKLLGIKREYSNGDSKSANVGFETYEIYGPKGPVTVMADQNCQATTGWGLDLRPGMWKFYGLDKCPHIMDEDGNASRLVTNTDTYRTNWAFYGNLGCRGPGNNFRLTLPAL